MKITGKCIALDVSHHALLRGHYIAAIAYCSSLSLIYILERLFPRPVATPRPQLLPVSPWHVCHTMHHTCPLYRNMQKHQNVSKYQWKGKIRQNIWIAADILLSPQSRHHVIMQDSTRGIKFFAAYTHTGASCNWQVHAELWAGFYINFKEYFF